MYKEIFGGYDSDSELSVQFSEDSDTVIVRDIQYYSMCEHHMLTILWKISIAYSPNGRVFGVSKLVRLLKNILNDYKSKNVLQKVLPMNFYSQGVKGVG